MACPVRKSNPGSRGGLVTASRMSREQLSARASAAGNAVLRRYGLDYYAALARAGRRCKSPEAVGAMA
jgi:hypothetical protein